MKACWNNHKDIVFLLVKHGAQINIQDQVPKFHSQLILFENNETALLKASWGGFVDIVSFLLENGADVNLPSNVRELKIFLT